MILIQQNTTRTHITTDLRGTHTMAAYLVLCTLVVLAAIQHSDGFLLDNKADCQMTHWTPWTEPRSFGPAYRERRINRYPTGGGSPCPANMVEVQSTDIRPYGGYFEPLPLPITATLMIDNFLRPSTQRSHKRGTNPSAMVRDLLLIVDASGSIGSSEFINSMNELIVLLKLLCPEQDPFDSKYNRAALIEFSSTAHVLFDFDDHQTSQQMFNTIKKTPYLTGNTCTGSAFYTAANLFKTSRGARISDPNVKGEVLIITDGNSNCGPNATSAAQHLQSFADVYALMIGKPSSSGASEIASYVSKPWASHLFATPNYQDLTKLVHLVLDQIRTHPQVHCMPFNP